MPDCLCPKQRLYALEHTIPIYAAYAQHKHELMKSTINIYIGVNIFSGR